MSPSLLLVYGPTAAGKLTVAKEIRDLTGWSLFHNHLSHSLVREIIPLGGVGYADLDHRVRTAVFEGASAAGVSLIHTFVYAPSPSSERIGAWLSRLFSPVYRVQLRPRIDVIEQRVVEESRATYGKLRGLETWRNQTIGRDIYAKADPADLSIDNSHLAPRKVAEMVVEHYRLPTVGSAPTASEMHS